MTSAICNLRSEILVALANEAAGPYQVDLANGFTVLQKDVLRVPYGETQNSRKADGKIVRYVQVFDRAAAEEIARNLANDLPIFIGHPDHPDFADDYKDKKAYGWITSAVAGEKEMLLNCKWSKAGEELLANAHFKYASPNWGCKLLESKTSVRKAKPFELYSIGLTNMPNIKAMAALVNEANNTNRGDNGMKDKLLKLLGLANEATEEQIVAGVETLANEKKASAEKVVALTAEKATAETALANEKTGRATALAEFNKVIETANAATESQRVAFANERKARIELVINEAIVAGKITAAQKPQWAADLATDFDGKVTTLANAKPVLSVQSKTKDLGNRKQEGASRIDRVLALVNERITKTGEDYEVAFCNVRKENEALFKEMKQPEKK